MRKTVKLITVRLGALLLVAPFLLGTIYGQGVDSLLGLVTDSATGAAISRATVSVRDSGGRLARSGITDEFGQFNFGRTIPPGNYTLACEATGYLERKIPATVRAGQGTQINFPLRSRSRVGRTGQFPALFLNVSNIAERTPVVFGSHTLDNSMTLVVDNVFLAPLKYPVVFTSLNGNDLPLELDRQDTGWIPVSGDWGGIVLEPRDTIRQIVISPVRAENYLLTYTVTSAELGETIQIYKNAGHSINGLFVTIDLSALPIDEVTLVVAGDFRDSIGDAHNNSGPSAPSIQYDPARDATEVKFQISTQISNTVSVGLGVTETIQLRFKEVRVTYK